MKLTMMLVELIRNKLVRPEYSYLLEHVESSYKYRNGCLAYADGMFYLYTHDGAMALAKPDDTGFELAGMLEIEDPGKNPTWSHPVTNLVSTMSPKVATRK